MTDGYYTDKYAARRAANETSRGWARKLGEPWDPWEDDILLAFWIDVAAQDRDEVKVSMCLERTIESCRARCEKIRERLGIKVFTITHTVVVEEVCPNCWLIHRGECDR